MYLKRLCVVLVGVILLPAIAFSQELENDDSTLLLLRFNGDASGVGGESPQINSGVTYVDGIHGQAIRGGNSAALSYLADDNLTQEEGTFEAWVRSRWNGDDAVNHTLLYHQWGNGILLEKDGGNYWVMLKDYAPPEYTNSGLGWYAGGWIAEEWHHIAFTWSPTKTEIYIDGSRVSHRNHDQAAFPVDDPTFRLLGDGGSRFFDGDVDELRISDRVRSPQEILASFLAGTEVQGLVFDQPNADLYPTWRHWLTGQIETASGDDIEIDPKGLEWVSSDSSVATFDFEQGYITGHTPGTATLTASIAGYEATVEVSVATPVLEPDMQENIDPSLTTPTDGALKEMPVVMITYIPTLDGVNLDTVEGGDLFGPLTIDDVKDRIDRLAIQTKFMLEERTKFHGYKNEEANPYLGYRVLKHYYVYEPFPRLKSYRGFRLADYWPIIKRFGIDNEVNELGVKEVWINTYHNLSLTGWESNMSSPLTGDISNSDRSNDDLPICDTTYIVYNYNWSRSNAENVHNHGHQLESMFSHLNWLQDGNVQLFWNDFVGRGSGNEPPIGRAGDTHHPPNTMVDYDYLNMTSVESDVEDWRPTGGIKNAVNAATWGEIDYAWPYGVLPWQDVESNFYIYWMQNMPGPLNQVPHGNRRMENWWRHVYDWDASILESRGLHTSEHIADEVVIERGLRSSGNKLSLLEKDNLPYRIRRNPINPQSKVDVRLKTISAPTAPTKLEVHVSSRVFARGSISQKVSLFNFQTELFEEIDSSAMSSVEYDDRIATASGNLSRFLDPDTQQVEAKIEFIANRNRQMFTAALDQALFVIEQENGQRSAQASPEPYPLPCPCCQCHNEFFDQPDGDIKNPKRNGKPLSNSSQPKPKKITREPNHAKKN